MPWAGSPTGSLATTGALALITFLTVVVAGSLKMGMVGFWKGLVPPIDVPLVIRIPLWIMIFVIELLGLCIKHFVLAMRLLANMMAGHVVLAVLVGEAAHGHCSGLLNDPIVLFMDGARSLDPGAAQNLRDFIKDYIVKEKGKTIFLSTHNLDEAEQLCNRIAIFDEGRIVVTGSPEELKISLEKKTLCDVFTHYTGKSFEGQGIAGGSCPEPRTFRRRGGFA